MTEKYTGPRFQVDLTQKELPCSDQASQLIDWAKKLALWGLAPKVEGGYGGNLSYRTHTGFVITGAGSNLAQLTTQALVEVLSFDFQTNQIKAVGLVLPSSESMLHHAIYATRKDVGAIFHGHLNFDDPDFMKKFKDIPITEHEAPYGSVALVDEVIKILGNHAVVLIKNHGFLAFGRDIELAGEEIRLGLRIKVKG